MPRGIKKQTTAKVAKKDTSKAIKKAEKVDKKVEVEKAVLTNKDVVHYILILDDSGSMSGSPWTNLKNATSEFITTLAKSR